MARPGTFDAPHSLRKEELLTCLDASLLAPIIDLVPLIFTYCEALRLRDRPTIKQSYQWKSTYGGEGNLSNPMGLALNSSLVKFTFLMLGFIKSLYFTKMMGLSSEALELKARMKESLTNLIV